MEMWIMWLVVAIALLIVEVLSQQIWALCLAVGSLVSMAFDLAGFDFIWQIVGLTVAGVLAFLILAPILKRWHHLIYKKTTREHRTGMDALLGRDAEVIYDIHPGEMGRVRIDGDFWQARAPHCAETIRKGATVVVESYDSIILSVQNKCAK